MDVDELVIDPNQLEKGGSKAGDGIKEDDESDEKGF